MVRKLLGSFNKSYVFKGINTDPVLLKNYGVDDRFVAARDVKGNIDTLRAQDYMIAVLEGKKIYDKAQRDAGREVRIHVGRGMQPQHQTIGRSMQPHHQTIGRSKQPHHQTIGRSMLHGQTLSSLRYH